MRHFTIIACLCLVSSAIAQTITIPVQPGDTLLLDAGTFRGQIQWQVSTDSVNWSDIAEADTSPWAYTITSIPVYLRARVTEGACDPVFSPTVHVIHQNPENDFQYWSDPHTWGEAGKPVAGDTVSIPEGQHIILDESTPALSGLIINGTLAFDQKDLQLTSDWVMVHGLLQIGSVSQPFMHKATITLTGTDPNQSVMGMGTRGLMVMGGTLELHGATPDVLWTKINDHAPAGNTNLQLIEVVTWKAGDEIVIAPTDYFMAGNGASVSQRLTLSGVEEDLLTTQEALNAFRWGKLQYATYEGMSLTPTNVISPPLPDTETHHTPTMLDQRAPVGNVTRNIVIQAPDDQLWQNQGFGAHVMIMGTGATAHIDGVEFRRSGQRGRLARYAFHWHMLSYSGTQTLADATGQYVKNSSISHSRNRGIVIHGTNGVLVQNNILFDIEGHGIFTEDAVERRNIIDGNLVMRVRNPALPAHLALKQHEVGERGSSGFWISNPDNTITNNTAADCSTNGFWLSFPANPWGESSSVLAEDGLLMNPSRIQFGTFDNNTAHSNLLEGIMLDEVEIDTEGNTFPRQYMSTTDGRDIQWPFPTLRRFTLSNYKVWKNGRRGIWDRAVWPDNYGVVSADNCERFFAGSGADGVIERCLVVGTSLNHLMNGTDRPTSHNGSFSDGQSTSTPVGFATYHSTFDIKNNIIMNFQPVENTWSGVFSTDDYYTRPVEKGMIRNQNNLIINSHPGVKLKAQFDYFTLASALWDPSGYWGPAGNYFVYDDPFLTLGKEVTEVAPGTEISGGVSVPGPFYGFEGFVLHGVGDTPPQNQPYMDLMGIHVRRLDLALNEVATWTVPEAQPHFLLQHMRDFATTPDAIYELTFPQEAESPTNFQMNVENMLTPEDVQVMGIQFDGSLNPIVRMVSFQNGYNYQQVNSLQQVLDSDGETWWQDKANDRIWVKLRGGRWQFWTNDPNTAVPSGDDLLYETSILRIFEP